MISYLILFENPNLTFVITLKLIYFFLILYIEEKSYQYKKIYTII